MPENQNIEWKESWRDEYLKWICGFANAQGGKIYIGTDDEGSIIGVPDSKKLLEDIPNKVRDILGILVDVNLLGQDDKDYIEICVAPSSYPVNYKGEYHYRSGSTKQLLKGAALTEFLLSKTGYKWDSVPMDSVTVEELDKESFDIFRREALRSGRMTEEDLKMSNRQLLDSLGLLGQGKLKRAAILLFHRNPEKWVTGAYIKIGYFGEGSDLRYQDEIHGSLFIQADRVVELIYLKYMKAMISYDNVTRIETYPLPKAAVREAVYNAIIHSNYAALVPIQIRIHEDAVYISNDCVFPIGWSVDTLMERHRSQPYNPNIANGFFRAGYVETWGRGIEKICEACKNHGVPGPEYKLNLEDIMVKFTPLKQPNILKGQNVLINDPLNDLIENSLEKIVITVIKENPHVTQAQLAAKLNRSERQIRRVIKELREKSLIERAGSRKSGQWIVK
ncbi:RNA-binding domain-containing protein [Holdemania massiliensis]|uniref:RNA-binding domain-containing protein n=1 Tax=Holdemania massiliensis TaxID=1468449 RepID=UPI001F0606C5|nr:ATP-binding protein [Holdemania massiliensis]MCH1939263.1 putative DNA binding domain-containing protein [Holdemania massiliensis]